MGSSLLRIVSRIKGFFSTRRGDKEFGHELDSHLEMLAEENVRRGMSPSEARRQAHIRLGSPAQLRETNHNLCGLPFLETLWQDVRFALRVLRRSPGFSILAILCLTLGIGANAAVFSWIEGLLLRPFPAVAHQERLFAVSGTAAGESDYPDLSWPDFVDLQQNCKLFDALIADKIMSAALNIGGRAERAIGSIVSANYFDALGVRPILGRAFKPGEDAGRNSHPVAVISYQMWQDRFKGDPEIIGKAQTFNRVQFTIIGVAPKGFYGTFVGWAIQFWVPASMEEVFEAGNYNQEDRSARWIEGFAILKRGVNRTQAQTEISAVADRLAAAYPEIDRGRNVKILPLWLTPFNKAGELRPTLEIMLAVVVFVLLIACANVINLLLVRFFARRHEIMVRLAIGAARGRLLRQLLTEGLILSAFGAVGGLLVAHWCRYLLVMFFPSGSVVPYLPGEIDWRVLAISAGVCVLSTVLFAVVPAIQTSKIDLAAALKAEMGGLVSGQHKSWLRSGFVLVQVSLSFVLLVGAALLVQSLRAMEYMSPGFSTRGVLATYVDTFGSGYDAQRAENFQKQLAERLQALPGIESAAFTEFVPLGLIPPPSAPIAVEGYVPPPNEQPVVDYIQVGPGYFGTAGISLVSGRDFNVTDNATAAAVAVVNEEMVTQYWGGRNPVGQRFQVKGKWLQVVGVARLSKYFSVAEAPRPFFYVPLLQDPSNRTSLLIKTSQPPQTVASLLAGVLSSMDPDLAQYPLISMQEQLDRSTSSQKAAVGLLGVLGGLALFLAAIGLYGVVTFSVAQGRRELGLRMALGADAVSVLWHVISQGIVLATSGAVLGTIAALALTRLISEMLYNVSPHDPLSFVLAFGVMVFISMAACFVPAWRAARTDPAIALRYE